MIKNIKGTVRFKACGDNIYKFINEIRSNHIPCFSQQCRDGVFYGSIYSNSLKRVSAIAENMEVDFEIINKKGINFKLYAYRFRAGIIIGIVFVLGFVFYLSNTVVSIEVCGNTNVSDKQVITALEAVGVTKGAFIPDIDFHSCEQKLRLSIPEIAWTGIRHTGSRIVVDITETVESPEMVNNNIPCNIVALKDAQITYAEVYAGRLSRKIGDGVKKDDIIISGTVQDNAGNILKKHAMGKVTGIYKEEAVFEENFMQTNQVYSENTYKRKYFDFFGFRVPLFFKGVECNSFDYNEKSVSFSFLGFELPLGVIHCTYEPFEYKDITLTESEAEIKLEQQIALHEKNFYDSKQIKILNKEIVKSITEEKIQYKITYTLEGNIAVDKEIYVDK